MKYLIALSLFVIALVSFPSGPGEAASLAIHNPAPLELSFVVENPDDFEWELKILSQFGDEVGRIPYFCDNQRYHYEYTATREGGSWLLTVPGKLGWGTGISCSGNKRWRVWPTSKGAVVERLLDEVTHSNATTYEWVDGIEYEITHELRGYPGHYDWVEVSRWAL
ncbi:MAG: hypothetical protein KDB07_07670 [Planctomycetes bacterium]|nr:hypothetical protein [Planctomycetota bacterium]